MTKTIRRVLATSYKLLKSVNPEQLLQLWMFGWAFVLYTTLVSQGPVHTLEVALIGMLSFTNILGLPVPIAALLVDSQDTVKQTLFTGLVMLVNAVKRMTGTGTKDLSVYTAKVQRIFRRLKQLESDIYLGLDVDLSDTQDAFMRAVDELVHALDMQAYFSESPLH